MRDRLENFGETLLGLVPEVLAFLLILIVGFIVASVLKKVTTKLLNKLQNAGPLRKHTDKVGNRSTVKNVLGVGSTIVYWVVVLFTLYFAFSVFGDNPITLLLLGILAFLPKLIVAIVIVVIAAVIAGVVRQVVSGALGGLSYGKVLGTVAGAIILGIGVFAALTQVGVATTILLPILIAFLAIIVGVTVVGVGGALITVLRPRLETAFTSAQSELQNVKNKGETDNPDNGTPVVVTQSPITRSVRSTQLPNDTRFQ